MDRIEKRLDYVEKPLELALTELAFIRDVLKAGGLSFRGLRPGSGSGANRILRDDWVCQVTDSCCL